MEKKRVNQRPAKVKVNSLSENIMIKNIIDLFEKSILPDKRFKKHKIMSRGLIKKLADNGFLEESEMVAQCGSWLLFSRQQHVETFEKRLLLKRANFCKYRFCPMCQWRRSMTVCRELNVALDDIQSKHDVAYIFMTFTIKNTSVSNLKKSVKELNTAFRRMFQTKAYKSAILGHFKAIEILGNKTPAGEVHPHIHVLGIVRRSYFKSRKYLSQQKWVDIWKKALKVDYIPQVDVRRIYANPKKGYTVLQSAIYEVAKYSIKPSMLLKRSDNDFRQIVNQTYRMRFYATWGLLKLKLQTIKEQFVDIDEKEKKFWYEIEQLLYTWNNNNYYLEMGD